jgi:hypothetical protein
VIGKEVLTHTLQRAALAFVALSAAIFGIALVHTPRADALVYWTTLAVPGFPHLGSIGVARPDGSGASNNFINYEYEAEGVAVDASHIYWSDDSFLVEGVGRGAVSRANLDGSARNPVLVAVGVPLSGPSFLAPTDVAAGGGYVYWADLNHQSIGRATTDGGGVDHAFIDSAYPGDIAVAGDHIYWRTCDTVCYLDAEWIARANLDGSGIDRNFLLADPNPSTSLAGGGLAVSAGHIYWAIDFPISSDDPVIARANLDGSGADESFINLRYGSYAGWGLAVNDSHIYWADHNGNTIGRARLDGSDVDPNHITVGPDDDSEEAGFVRPLDVAADNRTQLPPLDGAGGNGDQACGEAKAKLQKAKKKLKKAKKALKQAKQNGADAQVAKAKKKVKKAKKKVKKAKKAVKACG